MARSSIPPDHLPEAAVNASLQFRDALLAILGDDLVGLWLYGGTTFPDRPLIVGDLDLLAVVADTLPSERRLRDWIDDPTSRPRRIIAAAEQVEKDHGRGIDPAFVLAAEAASGELPANPFMQRRHNTGWAVVRAHLLAGQYVHLHGRHPDELMVPPTEAELTYALDRELEHLERHVHEGDAADPYEATYAIWNGCRILHTLDTGSPVLSKRSAGAWGLEHLPERWHDAIHAAGRSYDGVATLEDNELLRVTMPPFVEMVRERLPATGERDGPPRWS